MKIIKQDIEKYLNSFEWEFREIFFEKSKSFSFWCINWTWKTPSYSILDGFSVLSRTNKKEYFKSYSNFLDIEDKILSFKKEFWLWENKQKLVLNWEKELFLDDLEEIDFEINDIINNTNKIFQEYIKDVNFISSSEISLILSRKSFVVWNSAWNFRKNNNFYNTFFIKLIWEKNWNREEVFEKITWDFILEKIDFENIKNIILKAINTLKDALLWEASPSWEMDVIIWNEAGGTIIHEAIWHGLEADLQNSSVYKWKLWQKVAQDFVSVVDNPTTKFERWFYEFDHEWNKWENTYLIKNWILVSYLHNEKTAKKFKTTSTWHWRKETYKHKSLVRMWNTYLLPWKDKKEDLIKKVKNWIYVSRMWWGQVNTTTWDFVFKVQSGFLIENWNLTKNVRWATLSWNWPKMLNEIYWICDDLDFFDWWTCGKWQSMPVSDGTPTVWTKLKVSSFE